jgi:hypothetical protein
MSWVKQKATPNLKDAKAETMVALPSLRKEKNSIDQSHVFLVIDCGGKNDSRDEVGDTGDVHVSGGEGSRHWGLSQRQRDTSTKKHILANKFK